MTIALKTIKRPAHGALILKDRVIALMFLFLYIALGLVGSLIAGYFYQFLNLIKSL